MLGLEFRRPLPGWGIATVQTASSSMLTPVELCLLSPPGLQLPQLVFKGFALCHFFYSRTGRQRLSLLYFSFPFLFCFSLSSCKLSSCGVAGGQRLAAVPLGCRKSCMDLGVGVCLLNVLSQRLTCGCYLDHEQCDRCVVLPAHTQLLVAWVLCISFL